MLSHISVNNQLGRPNLKKISLSLSVRIVSKITKLCEKRTITVNFFGLLHVFAAEITGQAYIIYK